MAYRLDIPEELSHIHSTFHVSHLQKCVLNEDEVLSLDVIQVAERLNVTTRNFHLYEHYLFNRR